MRGIPLILWVSLQLIQTSVGLEDRGSQLLERLLRRYIDNNRVTEQKSLVKRGVNVPLYECRDHEYDTITSSTGMLKTPQRFGLYPNNFDCGWTISAQPGQTIELKVKYFDVEGTYDKLRIYDGPTDTTQYFKGEFSNDNIMQNKFNSATNRLTLKFTTDESVTHRGFKIKFTVKGEASGETPTAPEAPAESENDVNILEGECEYGVTRLTATSGDFASPGYGSGRLASLCETFYEIEVPQGSRIHLHFESFSLTPDTDCWTDSLQIFDGDEFDGAEIGNYCGSNTPPDFTSTGHMIAINLYTGENPSVRGFHARYTTVAAEDVPPVPETSTTSSTTSTTTTTTQATSTPNIITATPTPVSTGPCGGITTLQGSGEIDFPGHGLSSYPSHCRKTWIIQVPNGQVSLHFLRMSIESDASCAYDSLVARDGSTNTSPLIGRPLCGTANPAEIKSTGSSLYLKFTSDGDINLAGFKLTYGPCTSCVNQAPVSDGPAPVDDTPQAAPADQTGMSCTFESGTCGWMQATGENFDWVRHKGSTATEDTGPSTDHTYKSANGYYLYVESSAPRVANDKAGLKSPLIQAGSGRCLYFYYYMYGSGVGSLKVLIRKEGQADVVVWERHGNHGQRWHMARVSTESAEDYRVVIEGTTTGSIWGDIAIDDIRVNSQACVAIQSHCGRTIYTRRSARATRRVGGRVKRVAGGVEAQYQQFPWIVHMRTYNDDQSAYVRCGGSLIDRKWVLTAAHCLEIGGKRVTDPTKVHMFMGEHNVERDESFDYQYSADRVIVHPQRTKFGAGPFDVALIRVSREVELTQSVNLVCLPSVTDSYPEGTGCVSSGWGATGTASNSEVLLFVNMTIANKPRCSSIFGAELVGDDVICAGHNSQEKTSCRGDSGGPLVTYTQDHFTQIGVVSWGAVCGRTGGGIPSGYASVQYFLDWIETTIQDNS